MNNLPENGKEVTKKPNCDNDFKQTTPIEYFDDKKKRGSILRLIVDHKPE